MGKDEKQDKSQVPVPQPPGKVPPMVPKVAERTTVKSVRAGDAVQTTERFLKIMIYGASGVGKTTAASLLPKPIFLLTESKAVFESIAPYNQEAEIFHIRSQKEMFDAIDALELRFQDQLPDDDTWVVLDSITDFGDMMKYRLQELRGEKFSQNDWGIIVGNLRKAAWRLRDLPCNMLITARSEEVTLETGKKITRPNLTGRNTYQDVASVLHLVGYMYAKTSGASDEEQQTNRMLHFQNDELHFAKGNSLLATTEWPNLMHIIQKMRETPDIEAVRRSMFGQKEGE